MSSSTQPQVTYYEPPVYLSAEEIEKRIQELAYQINRDYAGKEIVAICTLKGSVVFYHDLLKKLKMPVHCEFLGTSSYGNQTTSSGEVKVTLDLTEPLVGKDVLIVEDIVDSGLTLSFVLDYLKSRRPASLKTAALLFKPEALKAKDLQLDYIGFKIPNKFVVGFGLDYAEKFRGLPYIGVLENEH